MKAPYRFVDLNKKVIYPEWGEYVFHDVPLKNAKSGELKLKITAVTPIYVKDSESDEFFNFNSTFMIPGSSIKGMLRSIIEVLSFCKLNTDNKTFAYRDLNHPSYKKKMMNTNKIYHGWLIKKDNEWKIESLGKIGRVNRLKYNDEEFKRAVGERNINKIRNKRAAYEKYRICGNNLPETRNGYIVFTGKVGKKKTREFLFEKKQPERVYTLSKNVIENFKSAYYLENPSLVNENWKELWAEKFEKGEKIPVFFQLDENGTIKHFGLSMLYKLPYENSTMDLVKNYQDYKNKPDFAQILFGYAEEEGLKGRVFVSHHIGVKIKNHPPVRAVLASPRPTFFLHYIKQNQNKCITYDDKNAVLNGFKFYPHKNHILRNTGNGNENTMTTLKPLDKGSEFEGKIRFFNLNEIELGALLSALSLFNKQNVYHKLGMGKPLGFGTVKIKISSDIDIQKYINIFENYVISKVGKDEYTKRKNQLLKYHTFEINEQDLEYIDFPNGYKELKRKCLQTRNNKRNNYRKKQSNNSSLGNIRIKRR